MMAHPVASPSRRGAWRSLANSRLISARNRLRSRR
jgi:hypothetical protein